MKLRRFIRFTLRALLLLLICLAGIVVGIQTPWAKRVICSFLSDKLSTAAGMDVQIRDLSGVLPLTATIGHVSVTDAEGIWLEIRSIDFGWTPLRLLDGELSIRRFVVDEVLLARKPSRPAVESRSEATERSKMAQVPLHIEQAALRRLVLDESVLGVPVEIRVGANGFLFTQNDHFQVEATYVVGTHPESAATVVWRGLENNPALDVQLGIPATPYLEQPGHLSATLVPRKGEWEARLDLRIADADFVSTQLTGSMARASAVLEVHGTTKLPLELAATITFEQSASRKEVTVTRLDGGYSEIPFHLLQPLQLTIENDGVSIPSLAAQVKGQVLEGEAIIREEQLNARIACKQVDSSILGGVPASWENLSLEVLASGSPAQPRVEATGALSGLGFHHPHSEGHPPLVADVRAILEGTELKADLEAQANDRFQVAVETRFPAALSFRPFTFALDARNPEYLSTAGHLDLSLFNEMPIHGSMQVSGQLVADLEYDGKTGSIRARGPTRITDGRFEEAVLGTVLEEINAEMGVETDRLVLKEVSARAGEGSVLLGGAFQLPSATGTPLRISAKMQNALLLNRDDVRVSVSGLAELTYREGGMDLSGSLTVDSGEIRVDHLPGGSAESFEVVEVGGNRPVSEEATTATQTKSGFPLSGQLDIAIPGPFRVRGRDIDTSWRGDLTASREQEGWSVNGRLNTQRGRVTFLSRTFVLDSGTLYLGGNVPPIPVVDITARHQRARITAIAHLRGPVQDPIIQLSSVPALPQDEIFSHVLFGRSMSDITTLQAVTLANTIRSQATGRRRSDSMQSRVQDRLGVDLVGLQESRTEEGETEVLLGRQFSSSTYVEFNSSLGSSGSGIRVEYEITPRLSIETESGTRMRPGFGVNWRYNY